MRHIPNILSTIRILLVGVFIYTFLKGSYVGSVIIYVSAFLTDLLDGYLARRFDWTSKIGKVLDPFADKLMLVAVLACFYSIGKLNKWILIVIACVEFIMIAVSAVLYFRKVVVYADWFGKIATGLFGVAILLTFVNIIYNSCLWYEYVYIAAVTASLIAFVHYGVNTLKHHYNKQAGND